MHDTINTNRRRTNCYDSFSKENVFSARRTMAEQTPYMEAVQKRFQNQICRLLYGNHLGVYSAGHNYFSLLARI